MKRRAGWRWFSYEPEDAKAVQAHLNGLVKEVLGKGEGGDWGAQFCRV